MERMWWELFLLSVVFTENPSWMRFVSSALRSYLCKATRFCCSYQVGRSSRLLPDTSDSRSSCDLIHALEPEHKMQITAEVLPGTQLSDKDAAVLLGRVHLAYFTILNRTLQVSAGIYLNLRPDAGQFVSFWFPKLRWPEIEKCTKGGRQTPEESSADGRGNPKRLKHQEEETQGHVEETAGRLLHVPGETSEVSVQELTFAVRAHERMPHFHDHVCPGVWVTTSPDSSEPTWTSSLTRRILLTGGGSRNFPLFCLSGM